MKKFNLVSKFKAAGDQPMAIKSLIEGIESGDQRQTLLGVTGSGKTYSMAEIIEKTGKISVKDIFPIGHSLESQTKSPKF